MDQDETPLLFKDKDFEPTPPSAGWWRSKPRFGRRLVPLVLVIAVLVFGGLFMLRGVPEHLRSAASREDDLDLVVRLRLLLQRMEEHYASNPDHDTTILTLPAIRRLLDCVEKETCGPGERDVVIFACQRFAGAEKGRVSGENIWAASTIRSFRAMNNTMLYGQGSMDSLLMYQHVPELVRLVFWESSSLDACIARNGTLDAYEDEDYRRAADNWQGGRGREKGCMVRDDFPDGIPYYKSLVFHFWGDARTPLGHEFTLAPWDFSALHDDTNRYLGFSIEDHCMTNKYYPPEERKHQALILGKLAEYFYPGPHNWIAHETLEEAVQDLPKENGEDFKLIATAKQDGVNGSTAVLPEHITNLGFQKQHEWTDLLARSKVMVSVCSAAFTPLSPIRPSPLLLPRAWPLKRLPPRKSANVQIGLGWPAYSPSPFDALCVGVPFINPIQYVNLEHPDDRKGWRTQNDALLALDPPYVYHVHKENATELGHALKSAIENPIPRFIREYKGL